MVAEAADGQISSAYALLCGLKPMREALERDVQALGLLKSHFHYEEFEIRSAIRLRLILAWVKKRIRK